MNTLRLEIRLYEYWHAGTGRGSGPVVDAEVVRTPAGLPYLPGRTVRGLLREGVQLAEESGLPEVPRGTTERLFGKPPEMMEKLEVGSLPDLASEEGVVRVSDATLGQELETWAGQAETAVAESLFEELAATAIDEQGQVKPKTLRGIEVAVPVDLAATLYLPADDAEAPRLIAAGLGFLRGLGTQRRRGLGRSRPAPRLNGSTPKAEGQASRPRVRGSGRSKPDGVLQTEAIFLQCSSPFFLSAGSIAEDAEGPVWGDLQIGRASQHLTRGDLH